MLPAARVFLPGRGSITPDEARQFAGALLRAANVVDTKTAHVTATENPVARCIHPDCGSDDIIEDGGGTLVCAGCGFDADVQVAQ